MLAMWRGSTRFRAKPCPGVDPGWAPLRAKKRVKTGVTADLRDG